MTVYGYARISTRKQNIERQIRNLIEYDADIKIYKESYTGTKLQGRTEFNKLLNKVVEGDTIVFDSVSRMSRNAEEGFKLYKELFEKNINLVFLKERYIDTDTYKSTLKNKIELVNDDVDILLNAINEYLMTLAEKQIKLAFEQSEKEVTDLSERTSEGLKTAKLKGKQVGQKKGSKLTTKKSIKAKEQIVKYSKDFEGTLSDSEVMKLTELSRNTYYKYKKELKEEY